MCVCVCVYSSPSYSVTCSRTSATSPCCSPTWFKYEYMYGFMCVCV